jgi:hypothetical protein
MPLYEYSFQGRIQDLGRGRRATRALHFKIDGQFQDFSNLNNFTMFTVKMFFANVRGGASFLPVALLPKGNISFARLIFMNNE